MAAGGTAILMEVIRRWLWREPGTEIWYYFDAEGYMKTGWIEENGVKYYCQLQALW